MQVYSKKNWFNAYTFNNPKIHKIPKILDLQHTDQQNLI